MGISIILLAGGEPLLRPEIVEITAKFPEIIFPLFTNGILLKDTLLDTIKRQKNIIPLLSLEGDVSWTDTRRGQGVYEQVQQTLKHLEKEKFFWGISLTATRENFKAITSETFIQTWIAQGCKTFLWVEYVPLQKHTENLMLTERQKKELINLTIEWRKRFSRPFIVFPGDEAEFGGCLAAGRGFIHISPEGQVEPCPFAPYADTNLKQLSLTDALKSEFLEKLRQHHHQLKESQGGCALWENRTWTQSLLQP